MNERELHDLLARTTDGVSPDLHRLRAGALKRGRRLRRRRRLGAGLVAAAAVAAIGLPLAGGGASTRGVDPASTVPSTGTSSPSTSPSGSPAATATPTAPGQEAAPFVSRPGWWDMPVRPMRSRLVDLLPEGVTVRSFDRRNTDAAPGESTRLQGHLSASLADQSGDLSSVEVMLIQLPDDPDARAAQLAQDLGCDLSGWEFEDLAAPARCENDGADTRLVSYTDQGVTYHEVRRRVGDGELYVAVANSVERKWGPPASAERPALDLEQVAAIAASDTWTDWSPRRR